MKKNLILCSLLIISLELIFSIFNNISLSFNMILFSILSGSLFSLVFVFKSKTNKKLFIGFSILLMILYIVQYLYFNIFNSFLSVGSLFNSGDLIKFGDSIIKVLLSNWYVIFIYILFIGLIIYLLRKVEFVKHNKKSFISNCIFVIIIYLICIGSLFIGEDSLYSNKNLYFNINVSRENVKSFGVLTTFRLDLQRSIFDFEEKNLYEYKDIDGNSYIINTDDYNMIDIDFNVDGNKEVKEISKYLSKQNPSKKNQYTGVFKDKNLIFIVGESFSSLSIDKDLTPTLYKLSKGGFQFSNFYNPLYPVSTADGQYMLDTGIVPAEGTWSILDVHNKYYPFTYGNSFKKLGYKTYAFHNYDYDYYERDKYFKTMGFDKYLGNGNGLEKYMSFDKKPSSDYEMFKNTFDIYSDEDKFLAYFITMSGHRDYDKKHAIVKKNWDKVKDLDYSDKVKAYLATQIELDKALEVLLKKLEEKNVLDDTVIVLAGDHYPYGLTKNEILEIDPKKKEDYSLERDRSTLIIYNNKINKKIDKYCFSMDVLPTILNLYGVEYDSRLLIGRDIMSNSSQFVLFSDRSFINDNGKYYSNINKFISFDNKSYDEEYISNIKNNIYLKYRNSRLILENDYYKYIFE